MSSRALYPLLILSSILLIACANNNSSLANKSQTALRCFGGNEANKIEYKQGTPTLVYDSNQALASGCIAKDAN